jgi:hypothetical protein
VLASTTSAVLTANPSLIAVQLQQSCAYFVPVSRSLGFLCSDINNFHTNLSRDLCDFYSSSYTISAHLLSFGSSPQLQIISSVSACSTSPSSFIHPLPTSLTHVHTSSYSVLRIHHKRNHNQFLITPKGHVLFVIVLRVS